MDPNHARDQKCATDPNGTKIPNNTMYPKEAMDPKDASDPKDATSQILKMHRMKEKQYIRKAINSKYASDS